MVIAAAAAAAAAGCMLALLTVLPPASAFGAEGEACPNAGVRVGYSALLADCRAYERVSPAGSPPDYEQRGVYGRFSEGNGNPKKVAVASMTGDAFEFQSTVPSADAVSSGEELRAVRGPDGWSTEDLSPPQSPNQSVLCPDGYVAAYSPDLSRYVLADGWGQNLEKGTIRCGRDDPLLVAGEPVGFQNLFVGEREAGPYELIDSLSSAPEGSEATNAWFEDASEDLSHVLFNEGARLTPEAPDGNDLYDWSSGGSLRLVTRFPDGAPVEGSLANAQVLVGVEGKPELSEDEVPGSQIYTHAMSSDGSRVYFQSGGNLYVRLNPEEPQSALGEGGVCNEPAAACTLEVDSAQEGRESGGGRFMWAIPDGEKVFFLDERRLTAEATAVSGKPDLYEYDLGAPVGARLRDLTVLVGEAADVLGVSGISSDGDYVYFVADGALTSARSGSGSTPIAGQPNLYLWHDGSITFIAMLNPPVLNKEGCLSVDPEDVGDMEDWSTYFVPRPPCDAVGRVGVKGIAALVTPSGEYLAFNSQRELTGYANVDVKTGEHDDEIFLYRASDNRVVCASCDPSGAPSVSRAQMPEPMQQAVNEIELDPTWGFQRRSLAEDGRVFFSTAQPLLSQASNGQENVYEYAGGVLHLLSTGTSGLPSYFYEATPDGGDVFIVTAQELPSATEGEYALYDVREGGGFPVAPEAGCVEEECRGAAPAYSTASAPLTTGVTGAENVLGFQHSSAALAGSHPAESRLQAALGACQRDTSVRKRRACEASVREAHRRELLREALLACRAKQKGRSRSVCETKARRAYGVSATGRRRK